jgi:S-DNA-T family DNA segregation ATPase FtsK/SpoIIIE
MENKDFNSEDDILLNTYGPYDARLDLSSYSYPKMDMIPNELRSIFNYTGTVGSSLQMPILLSGGDSPTFTDIYQYPNVLIAGTTGFGKTQFIYNQIVSWIFTKHPAELKLVICRNKVVDYNFVNRLERHFGSKAASLSNVLVEPQDFGITIQGLKLECENRLSLFANASVKNIKDYNSLFVRRKLNPEDGHRFIPDIVFIIDDLSNFINNSESVSALIQLSQQNLYTGIYILAATNQINARSISLQLRANFSLRISMKLMSQSESRKILDKSGAEKLIFPGEILYTDRGNIKKGKQPYIDYSTIESICTFIGDQRGYSSAFLLPEILDHSEFEQPDFDFNERHPLFEEAARLIVAHQQGSTSLIQRRLKLGYNQAGRIIDQLVSVGIIGPFEGSKAREVLYPDEYSLEQFLEILKNGTPSQIKKHVRHKEKDKTNEANNPNISPSEKAVSKGEVSMIDEPRTIVDEQPLVEYHKKKSDYTLFYILAAIVILLLVVYFI